MLGRLLKATQRDFDHALHRGTGGMVFGQPSLNRSEWVKILHLLSLLSQRIRHGTTAPKLTRKRRVEHVGVPPNQQHLQGELVMRRVRVKGHYRDGHWVKAHYRQLPESRTTIPPQRTRNNNSSNRTNSGRSPVIPLPSLTTNLWNNAGYKEHRRSIRKREKERIGETAEFCVSAVKDGGIEATADKIAKRVSRDTWDVLRRRWGRFRCKWMARLAQQILDAKAQMHETAADVVMLKWWNPLHTPERVFAHELLKSIPFPGVDEHFVAAAYGIRLTGVCLCATQGIPLTKCACFQPLALGWTKEQVKSFLVSRGDEWMRGSKSGLVG